MNAAVAGEKIWVFFHTSTSARLYSGRKGNEPHPLIGAVQAQREYAAAAVAGQGSHIVEQISAGDNAQIFPIRAKPVAQLVLQIFPFRENQRHAGQIAGGNAFLFRQLRIRPHESAPTVPG